MRISHTLSRHAQTTKTHRALGDDIAEEILVNDSSIPLLFEVETKENSDLWLIWLIGWVHLTDLDIQHPQPVRRCKLTSNFFFLGKAAT